MKKKRLLYGVAAASVLLGAAAIVSRNQPAKAAQVSALPAPEVPVATVIAKKLAPNIESTARIAAVQSADIRARVSGFVQSVSFEEGGLVRAGQVLFQLDARPFRASLARARAEQVVLSSRVRPGMRVKPRLVAMESGVSLAARGTP